MSRTTIIIGTHGNCGGTVRVKDWQSLDQWRYEAYCDKCRTCDPNGWGNRKDLVANASAYFDVVAAGADTTREDAESRVAKEGA